MKRLLICLSTLMLLGLAACTDNATEGDAGQAAQQEKVPGATTQSGTDENGATAQASD